MKDVTLKKKLEQHYLNNLDIAYKITNQSFINNRENAGKKYLCIVHICIKED